MQYQISWKLDSSGLEFEIWFIICHDTGGVSRGDIPAVAKDFHCYCHDRSEGLGSYPSHAFHRRSIRISTNERAIPFTGSWSCILMLVHSDQLNEMPSHPHAHHWSSCYRPVARAFSAIFGIKQLWEYQTDCLQQWESSV